MAELDTHAGFLRLRQYLGFLPGFFFVGLHIALERSLPCIPGHIQQTEADLAQAGVCHIEIGSVDNPLDKRFRNRFSGLVMPGERVQEFFFYGEVLHNL